MPLPLLSLDRSSVEPLYRQVRRAVEHAVTAGLLDSRQPLPSSRQLATELGVSRNTINLAYQELLAEGVVTSVERSGLFVSPTVRAALAEEPRGGDGQVDWRARVRRFGDAGMPHIEKTPDWHQHPYPFVAGQVDAQAFPATAWVRATREATYQPHLTPSLQDSLDADDALLVDVIRRQLLPSRGIEAAPEEILVTVGSQHGLDLLGRALLGDGTPVAMEDPGYLDARRIFRRHGAALQLWPVTEDGAVVPESLDGVELAYLTPSHQSPTNVTLSMDRRLRLLNAASEAGTVLVEDDYDSELRYHGSPTPALKALDTRGQVVYLGTFSKFLSPGLRLGYLVADPELVRALREIRRYELRHPSGLLQRTLALFVDSGDYHRSLRRTRRRLGEKWQRLTDAVQRELPSCTGLFPPGGVSIWLEGPAGLDAAHLQEHAQRRGVLIEPGSVFFDRPGPAQRRCFRLGYSSIPAAAIEPGVVALAAALADCLDERAPR